MVVKDYFEITKKAHLSLNEGHLRKLYLVWSSIFEVIVAIIIGTCSIPRMCWLIQPHQEGWSHPSTIHVNSLLLKLTILLSSISINHYG